MFESLPHYFRKHKVSADVRALLQLRKAIDKGLVNTLGDLYLVLKGLLTNDLKDFGPYTTAFYDYFLDIEIKQGEKLEQAVIRSETFRDWKAAKMEAYQIEEEQDVRDLVNQFLDEVHLSSFDIKKILSGEDILNKDDPNRPDLSPDDNPADPDKIEEAADYRNISLEELKQRLKKIAEQQRGKHKGGSHWIGSGGKSPFGMNGAAMGGMRMGGGGGGKMARAVIGDPQYYPVDAKVPLTDNNIDVALASLKGIEEEDAELLLDIPKTIKEGLKQGGIFLPYEKEKINQKIQVILLIDNGGLSMTPYIKMVTKLFSKMKKRFAHDLKTYYYHNTIYGGVYEDVRRKKFIPIDQLLKNDKNYSIFVIGDADMGPYELSPTSIECWERLKKRFARMIWLNPMKERLWQVSDTVPLLRRIVPMYTLTPGGIEKAVKKMNEKRRYSKTS